MEINRLAFVPRPRTPWQVFDLSLQFYRGNFWTMWKIYLAQALPLAFVLFLVFEPVVASLIFWWLKPLMERPLLDFLSKQTFSQDTSTKANLKVLKRLRIVDIVAMLTWLRLSPNRAYLASVEQLELLTGTARQKRKTLLIGRMQNKQTQWMLFMVHLEMILIFAIYMGLFFFLPNEDPISQMFDPYGESSLLQEQISFWIYVVVVSLIGPWFSCGGFMMYLNSRIKLEAWDLELGFKRLSLRLPQWAIAVIAAGIFTAALPQPVEAAQATNTELSSPLTENHDSSDKSTQQANKAGINGDEKSQRSLQVRNEIKNIYEENELINRKNIYKLSEDDTKEESSMPQWLEAFFSMFSWLSLLAPMIQWLLYGLILWFILWVVYRLYGIYSQQETVPSQRANKAPMKKNPQVVPEFFENIETQQWPDDLLAAAKHSLGEDDDRQALIYLLKYGLDYIGTAAPDLLTYSMTEPECQSAIKQNFSAQVFLPMQKLFALWMAKAWAHREIDTTEILSLIDVIDQLPIPQVNYEN
ncbi:hypothetical protein FE810_02760 [Thalassotalea litorea]|uniref:DUF4129 domain-containing protein n=1 Tax=Thalassotalea litorea TaxID=2020715 RepID=A0A5R9INX9_9GAMM|nr:hypothetical protein [Thalassotalea litorea]TLU67220.1 hypothetical protein FE810_02760 [Thalassotalea litorea]